MIYLTGDNAEQPGAQLTARLARRCWNNRRIIDEFCKTYSKLSATQGVNYDVVPSPPPAFPCKLIGETMDSRS